MSSAVAAASGVQECITIKYVFRGVTLVFLEVTGCVITLLQLMKNSVVHKVNEVKSSTFFITFNIMTNKIARTFSWSLRHKHSNLQRNATN